jgi:hypothetical protein
MRHGTVSCECRKDQGHDLAIPIDSEHILTWD